MIPRSALRRLCPDYWDDDERAFGALLVDDAAAWTPDAEADEMVADVVTAEVTATGYERAMLTPSVSWDSGNARWRLLCSSPSFGAIDAGTDVSGWWIYELGTDDSDSPLVVWLPFASVEATDGDTFTVTVDAEGVLRGQEIV